MLNFRKNDRIIPLPYMPKTITQMALQYLSAVMAVILLQLQFCVENEEENADNEAPYQPIHNINLPPIIFPMVA